MKVISKIFLLAFVVINLFAVTSSTKSIFSTNLFDLQSAFAWGGETPNTTYLFTADNPQPCDNCCPVESYVVHEGDGTWHQYSGSASAGATITMYGAPVTIEVNAAGIKGYYTYSGSVSTGTSDGRGTRHICLEASWTSSCKAGVACVSRTLYR